MPRSKRHKVVSLTKTKAKSMEDKTDTIEMLRSAVDEYKNVFAFTYENMRSAAFKEVRMHFKESRLFLGKNKVAQVALGKGKEEEYRENPHKVGAHLSGDSGLFFTNREKEEVVEYFSNLTFIDFAKAGFVPPENITLEVGPLPKFPTDMMEQLRKLGMVVEVENGVLMLRDQFKAAVKDKPLTPEQCKALAHMDVKLCPFVVKLLCFWNDGAYTKDVTAAAVAKKSKGSSKSRKGKAIK